MKNMIYTNTDNRGREKRHLVVYIEYHGKRPHSVTTLQWFEDEKQYRYPTHWDFEADGKSTGGDLIFFNSGGGGNVEIQAPHYVSGGETSYWIHDCIKFQEGTEPINCERIEKPFMLKSYHGKSRNPFKHGEETPCIDYCAACQAYYGEYGCDEHEYCDEHSQFGCDEEEHEKNEEEE